MITETRIVSWEEYKKPTFRVFVNYQIKQWILEEKNFEVIVVNGSIVEITKRIIENSGSREGRNIWLGLSSCQEWGALISYRNKHKSKATFSFYLNSIVSLEKELSEAVKITKKGDVIVFNSKFAKDTFDKLVVRDAEIDYCINSVSNAQVNLQKEARNIKNQKEELICIFCRLNPYKKIDTALKALSEMGWQGEIRIGLLPDKSKTGGYYLDELRRLIRKSNLKVTGLKAYGQTDIERIMSESLACIVLSTSYEETQGKVITEAARNDCMPIVNKWNGHIDYLPKHYPGLVKTNWNKYDGIYIDTMELAETVKDTIDLCKNNRTEYTSYCVQIMKELTNNSSKEVKHLQVAHHKKYGYLDLVEHFGYLTIYDKPKGYKLCDRYDIDYYLWNRYQIEISMADKLRDDLEWLKRNERYYQYAPLLDLIFEECMFRPGWKKEDMKEIVELIEEKGIYSEWSKQVREVFQI